MRILGFILLYAALLACSPRRLQTLDAAGTPAVSAVPVVQKAPQPSPGPILDAQGDTIVGHTDIPLTKAQPESSMGNFVADAMLSAARKLDKEVVAAVCNYGGVRLSYLPPGAITKTQLRQIMPFDNALVVLEIPGSVIQELCTLIARRKGWPVSGLTFTIHKQAAIDVFVGGEPLNLSKVYKLAVSNYLSKGGDECSFFAGLPTRRSRILVRDAIENWVLEHEKSGKALHSVLEKRIVYGD